jgi:hypothetical protein
MSGGKDTKIGGLSAGRTESLSDQNSIGTDTESTHAHLQQKTLAALEQARALLADNPTVVSVELGYKITAADLSSIPAIRVLVRDKMPASSVPEEHMIPDVIGGLPTDVIALTERELYGHDMTGGDQIKRIVWNAMSPGSGTLGCIATRVADSRPVMLSCEHVFLANEGHPAEQRDIFQPDLSRCMGSVCNGVGYATVGHRDNIHWVDPSVHTPPNDSDPTYYVDCALGELETDDYKPGISKVGAIAGSRDITQYVPTGTPIKVRKTGATTDFTEGTVVSVSTDFPATSDLESTNRIIIVRADTGKGKPYETRIRVPPHLVQDTIDAYNSKNPNGTVTDVGDNTLHFQVNTFSQGGDSGSAVVDDSGNIVGILYGGDYQMVIPDVGIPVKVPVGNAHICHIGPVMHQMGIRIDPAAAVSTADADRHFGPGSAIASDRPDRSIEQAVARLEARLRDSTVGRELVNAVREVGQEVVDLVHHRRPVMVAWHRNQGPQFAALLVQCVSDTQQALPPRVKETELDTLLIRMADALAAQGSRELVQVLEHWRDWILDWMMSARTVDGLLERLDGLTERVS